jgi:hypothetical protein
MPDTQNVGEFKLVDNGLRRMNVKSRLVEEQEKDDKHHV